MATEAEIRLLVSAKDEATKVFQSMRGELESFGKAAALTGGLMTAGLTLPLLGVGKAALDVATDYQSSMNLFQAVTGASADQMAKAATEAKALGADMSLPATSAGDAAAAMTELAKAGLSVEDTMAAAKGVLELSAAGSISNAEAAKIAADALNAFHLQGSEATRVANLLAAAANASSSEVGDLAYGLQASSAVFAAAGIPIEDLVANLAEMSNAGIASQDAGTSLKQMLLSLEAPTKKSAELMASLGIQIYDSNGKMRDWRDIISNVHDSIGSLTQQQRDQALATIFGSDAVRAANVIFGSGADAFDKMLTAVTKEGAAADLAGAKMKGLGGAVEGLKSTVETVLLGAIEPFLGTMEQLVRGTADLVGKLGDLDPNLVRAAAVFAGVLAAAGPLLLVVGGLATAFAFLISPLGIVIAGVAILAGVLASSPGLVTAFGKAFTSLTKLLSGDKSLSDFVQDLRDVGGQILDIILPAIKQLGADVLNFLTTQVPLWGQQLYDWVTVTAIPGLQAALPQYLDAIRSWVADNLPAVGEAFLSFGADAWTWISGTAVPAVREHLPEIIGAVRDWAVGKATEVGAALYDLGGQAWTWITESAVPAIRDHLAEIITAIGEWAQGAGDAVLGEFNLLASNAWTWITTIAVPGIKENLPKIIAAIGEWAGTTYESVLGEFNLLAKGAADWITATAIPEIQQELPQIITALGQWATAAVGDVTAAGAEVGKAFAQGFQQGAQSEKPQQAGPGPLDGIKETIIGAFDDIQKAIDEVYPKITAALDALVAAVGRLVDAVKTNLTPAWEELTQHTLPAAQKALEDFQSTQGHLNEGIGALSLGIVKLAGDFGAFKTQSNIQDATTDVQGLTNVMPALGVAAEGLAKGLTGAATALGDVAEGARKAVDQIAQLDFKGAWATAQKANDEAIGALKAAAIGALEAMGAQMGVTGSAAGAAAVNGMVGAINAGQGPVAAAVSALAATAEAAMRQRLDSHSPSKVFEQIGQDLTAGLVAGILSGSAEAQGAIGALVDALARRFPEGNKVLQDFAATVSDLATRIPDLGAAMGELGEREATLALDTQQLQQAQDALHGVQTQLQLSQLDLGAQNLEINRTLLPLQRELLQLQQGKRDAEDALLGPGRERVSQLQAQLDALQAQRDAAVEERKTNPFAVPPEVFDKQITDVKQKLTQAQKDLKPAELLIANAQGTARIAELQKQIQSLQSQQQIGGLTTQIDTLPLQEQANALQRLGLAKQAQVDADKSAVDGIKGWIDAAGKLDAAWTSLVKQLGAGKDLTKEQVDALTGSGKGGGLVDALYQATTAVTAYNVAQAKLAPIVTPKAAQVATPQATAAAGAGQGGGGPVVININGDTYGWTDFRAKVAQAWNEADARGETVHSR